MTPFGAWAGASRRYHHLLRWPNRQNPTVHSRRQRNRRSPVSCPLRLGRKQPNSRDGAARDFCRVCGRLRVSSSVEQAVFSLLKKRVHSAGFRNKTGQTLMPRGLFRVVVVVQGDAGVLERLKFPRRSERKKLREGLGDGYRRYLHPASSRRLLRTETTVLGVSGVAGLARAFKREVSLPLTLGTGHRPLQHFTPV